MSITEAGAMRLRIEELERESAELKAKIAESKASYELPKELVAGCYPEKLKEALKENFDLKVKIERMKSLCLESAGYVLENAELKKLVGLMAEALILADKEHPCPSKDYWQTVATTHHSGQCWHSRAKAALIAAKGGK